MTTSRYAVEGLTCPACLAVILERVRLMPGVTAVAMDLARGGASPMVVASTTPLPCFHVKVR
jgi:copper chaperone CopZ